MSMRMSEASVKSHLASRVSTVKIAKETYVSVEEDKIEWSNLIFLPFHPVFRMFVLFSVFIKAMLVRRHAVLIGPIQSAFPVVYCGDAMENYSVLLFIKYVYRYGCDSLYGIDTFLHIVHRQVNDKAMRREHLPKSALFLLLDILSLIPFYRLVQSDPCPPTKLWPNLLSFNEFLVIYRVTQQFSLTGTHSLIQLLIGSAIVFCLFLNCVICFLILLTVQGFCSNCLESDENFFDWRSYVSHKLNETYVGFTTYIYGGAFVLIYTLDVFLDSILPSAILEFLLISFLTVVGYILLNWVIVPKTLGEAALGLRRICLAHKIATKIIADTERRNPFDNAHKQVKMFYDLIWRKREGIFHPPEAFKALPRYLRIEVNQDLLWALFYHSSILRQTSQPFRRWITDNAVITYKLPGEKFFTTNQSGSNLYYLKSGIVQFISADDGVTPILSVTSGTIFGDINFLIPHVNRKVMVRCVTYCEIYYVQRLSIITGLYKYWKDRKIIMTAANNRIDHARTLFVNKQYIRGTDRNVDEGISWIRSRWWQIFNTVEILNKIPGMTKSQKKSRLSGEETIYHCSKYIGQLVLCTDIQLQIKSMFTNSEFPWILNQHSSFGQAWHWILTIHLVLVLYLYPVNLVKPAIPEWFIYFTLFSDTIYAADICVSLCTAMTNQGVVTSTFYVLLFERFKSFTFMLDILSTIWIESLANLLGHPEYFYTLQFNRVIKVYKLFFGEYLNLEINKDPGISVYRNIILISVANTAIFSHLLYDINSYVPTITSSFFYGHRLCSNKYVTSNCEPVPTWTGVSVLWEFETTFSEYLPRKLIDIYIGFAIWYLNFLVSLYCRSKFVAYVYLTKKDIIEYQKFVWDILHYYQTYKIHGDLLKRIDRYLICHWKHYKGEEVMYPNSIQEEPFQIRWKSHGEVAKRVIGESLAFRNANPSLIKDMAHAAKFLIMPRNSNLFMFGNVCKNAAWVVKGCIKTEYYSEEGDLLTAYIEPGNNVMSASSVFMGKVSLRNYIAYTDCEILYIPINEFHNIYKRYGQEYFYVELCKNEFGPQFDEMFHKHVLNHKDYQAKIRDKRKRMSLAMKTEVPDGIDIQPNRSLLFQGKLWGDPDSRFMLSWILFRAVTVCISIISASLMGGIGAVWRWIFMMICAFCDCIAWVDIIIKLCLAFYDKRGILITDRKICFLNYITKGFLMDVIGALPWYEVIRRHISKGISIDACLLINTTCKFAHIYIVFAYFEYIGDLPTVNIAYTTIVKWQIINILIVFGASHYLMVNCVNYVFDVEMTLLDVEKRNKCWMPLFNNLPQQLNREHLHLIFAQSLNLAQNGMLRQNFGRFIIDREDLGVGLILFVLGTIVWFITFYTLALLVLNNLGDTMFRNDVYHLFLFLKSERVEKKIIQRTIDHLQYSWIRTKGLNIEKLANERIGVVFRHDISYYLFKPTLTILDSLLGGGDAMLRQLAGASTQAFFLPDYDIFREMDLVTTLCIVHRGKVNIHREDKSIIVLTKGDIFGQLRERGKKVRPIRVTATTIDRVDLLFIDFSAFHSIINDQVRVNIIHSFQTKLDFMASKSIYIENPYDTVQYILRGQKTIMLPWFREPMESTHRSWYSHWLFLSWFLSPLISSFTVFAFYILPNETTWWLKLYCILFITDAIQICQTASEFYTIELVVKAKRCVPIRLGVKKFKSYDFYLDVLSLLIPLLTFIDDDWRFQFARLLRLHSFIHFEFHFCRIFKTRIKAGILKAGVVLLILHCFACGWIIISCRDETFPISIPDIKTLNATKMVDLGQWTHPEIRKQGCARTTKDITNDKGINMPGFVVPIHWPHDYVIAITYMLLIHTHTDVDTVIALSTSSAYYKLVITYFMYLLDLWITAEALSYVHTLFHEMYINDFNLQTMLSYMNKCGVCKSLTETVLEYTHLLWRRHKGERLPELAYDLPPCLRDDVFSALYAHHFDAPPSFRNLPDYFKRQLASRFRRMVIFPGKCIVREGDSFNTTYFIHEGELEKWYNDTLGDSKLLSIIYTNGYFGCISGLFVQRGFEFSYFSRTVVDLVFLNLDRWEDLLDGYPDIKQMLLNATDDIKKEYTKSNYGKGFSDTP